MERKGVKIVKLACVIGIAALIAIFFGDLLVDGIEILFGAGVICFLVSPLERLIAKKIPSPWSAVIALTAAAVVILGSIAAAVPSIIKQIGGSGSALTEAVERITDLINGAADAISARFPISLPNMDLSALEGGIAGFAGNAAEVISSVTDSAYKALLMAAMGYFFLADRERTLIRLELMVPAKIRGYAVRCGSALMHDLKLYLRGQATISLAVGALAIMGLMILGIPNAPILGAVVGLFNVIPYFGPVLGGIPAVLMAVGMGWQYALYTILVLFVVQQIDGFVISPRVMGSITGFSPGAVLLALYFGSKLGGVLGMLLAMPVMMAYRTLYRVFVQRYEMN